MDFRDFPRRWALVWVVAITLHFLGVFWGHLALQIATKPFGLIPLMFWLPLRNSGAGRYGYWLRIGLFWNLLGDMLLAIPGPGGQHHGPYFLHGLAAFLVGQLFYAAAFSSGGVALRWKRALPFFAYTVGMLLWMGPHLGKFLLPVGFYCLAIGTMMWRAAARVGHPGELRTAHWLVLIGALSYGISDSLIGINRFLFPVPGERYWIMSTYWLAQFCIVASSRRSSSLFSAD